MNEDSHGFIKGRFYGIKYALKGIYLAITTENSIKVQLCIGIFVTILGVVFKISATEWMIQFLVIGLVLVAETINTAIEKLADFIHPDYDFNIGAIKDISAGAAGLAAITSLIIACIIYIPKLIVLS